MIELDPKSRRTIFVQIVDNLRMLISVGVIAPDEKLPSVRDLSKQLTVNPNTIQKAFRELERQGYIYAVAGVGSFAADPKSIVPDDKLIMQSKMRLADDVREIRILAGSAAKTKEIVMDVLSVIEGSFTDNAAKEGGAGNA